MFDALDHFSIDTTVKNEVSVNQSDEQNLHEINIECNDSMRVGNYKHSEYSINPDGDKITFWYASAEGRRNPIEVDGYSQYDDIICKEKITIELHNDNYHDHQVSVERKKRLNYVTEKSRGREFMKKTSDSDYTYEYDSYDKDGIMRSKKVTQFTEKTGRVSDDIGQKTSRFSGQPDDGIPFVDSFQGFPDEHGRNMPPVDRTVWLGRNETNPDQMTVMISERNDNGGRTTKTWNNVENYNINAEHGDRNKLDVAPELQLKSVRPDEIKTF